MVGLKLGAGQESQKVGLRVFAGPNFSLHVNEKLDGVFQNVDKDDIKDSRISGILGGGVDLGILFVDLGYKFGLSSFFEDEVADDKVHYFIGVAGLRFGF
jgi:hypothetical protein